ncbi:splicing factor, suppressor of white-apricot homolog isoform X2 [Rhinatrema bivittatum]|uniref:splicing factor, suppressor of white-apricot homolog isoform X2 n=1 Tax=Rhinatrema bivittatum TaxID=194408 RepID=UPI00112941D9|nr:splicing factor, suppressor of white-apricot homolog isoform X2 [Rhinatrema bivittatum]XP_029427448.1 splicing factor, suppressor of white-apricot homolog isoform X2 [Rhinatrema bivittatum]
MKREEEYKRLSEALAEDDAYNAVGFRYGSDYYDPSQPTEEEEPQRERETSEPENAEDSEEPFIAPAGLIVPLDVELPPTAKMHAIIERTANFVCRQGAQFEIMLKTKQARNSQFDFLRFDHYLNPYYKLIQKAMKEGRYTAQSERKAEEKPKPEESMEEDDEEDGDDYLHPSLFASKKCDRLEEIMKPLKVVDPDHPLAALVRKAQTENTVAQQTDNVTIQASPVKYTTDSTVAAAMYYSYYMLPDGTYCLAPPPPGIDVATYYSALPAGMTIQAATGETVPPPPGTSPPPSSASTEASIALTSATTPVSSLAPVVAIIPPPPDIQPVIDKLAEYVARNGIKFETSVRAKNDPRFEFLQPWHEYNPYYEFKKQFFSQKECSSSSSQGAVPLEVIPTAGTTDTPCTDPFLADADSQVVSPEEDDSSALETLDIKKDSSASKIIYDGKLLKASFAPISFAIKAKENDLLPLEKNRVKLYDDSEEEEEGKEDQDAASSASHSNPAVIAPCPVIEEKKPQLTQEELEAKQAKQKLEDRLAAAAREKLAQASKESKEKQLQAERKRKAALFLQTLKSPLLDVESARVEENTFNVEAVSSMACTLLAGDNILPTYDISPIESPSSRSKEPPREEEKEKKKKKHKKRSRSRSPTKYHSASKSRSRSRSHPKAKHSLPSAYRTVRRSRSRSKSPRRRLPSPESHREEREREKGVPSAYRVSNAPGISRKRTRSRSPHEKKKKQHSQSHTKSKPSSHSPSASPGMQPENKSSVRSASISPMESRESSQERSGGDSQEKDGHISSAIVSSVQSKITQDLMAKVRAMLAASKNMQTSAS